MIEFTLYSRSYCHLCQDMNEALVSLLAGIPHRIAIVDVDQDPNLLAQFDELVPVLFGRKGQAGPVDSVGEQLCHYFLDAEKVKAFCND